MRKLCALTALCMVLGAPLSASLPPLYQSVSELQAIVNHKDLGHFLHAGESILDIRKVDEGYLITTNHQVVLAQVIIEPATRPGPAKFMIAFKKVETPPPGNMPPPGSMPPSGNMSYPGNMPPSAKPPVTK